MVREHFKTFILIVLFITSLTLTQQLWIALPLGEAISTTNKFNSENLDIDVADVLSPQSFVVSFGGGHHTVFFAEPYETWNITKISKKEKIWIWKTAKDVLGDYFTKKYEIESIDLDVWKSMNRFKSIRMDFGCEIPGEAFIGALVGNSNITQKNIGNINSLLIPAIDTEKTNIYMANTNENIYFRLNGKEIGDEIRQLIKNIEELGDGKTYISYYPLKQYIPINSENEDVLIPYLDDAAIPSIEVMNEIDVFDKAQIKTLSNKFFGENFDFVKEIMETDGTVIYMYGYGEKALKINANGVLEHIEKVNKQKTKKNLDFLEGLKIAATFIGEHPDWPINAENAYLTGYEIVKKDKKKGYRFYFNYRLNGLPVFVPYIEGDKAIEIEVIGDQITYYKRYIKRKRISKKKTKKEQIPLITEILAKNIVSIKQDYAEKNDISIQEVDDIQILEDIKGVELAYYSKEDRLIPVWKIVIGDKAYYFDLYKGKMLYPY